MILIRRWSSETLANWSSTKPIVRWIEALRTLSHRTVFCFCFVDIRGFPLLTASALYIPLTAYWLLDYACFLVLSPSVSHVKDLVKDPVTMMGNVWAHWHPYPPTCMGSFFSLQDLSPFYPFDSSSEVSCLHFPLAHLAGLSFIATALPETEKSTTKSENTVSQMRVPS